MNTKVLVEVVSLNFLKLIDMYKEYSIQSINFSFTISVIKRFISKVSNSLKKQFYKSTISKKAKTVKVNLKSILLDKVKRLC